MKILIGFIPKVDVLPKAAVQHGLTKRFAFITPSFDEGEVDSVFDHRLYAAIVREVETALTADRVELSGDLESLPTSAADIFKRLESLPSSERTPFDRLLFVRGGRAVGILVSEPWALAGGPDPYHDSYTLALFCEESNADRLVEAGKRAAKVSHTTVTEIIVGSDAPTTPRPFARIVSWIRGRR